METRSLSFGSDYECHNESSSASESSSEQGECLRDINRSLVFCKLFYFFYNSAMGSLWSYLPLYFRQLFLTPRQVGAIVASRTFVQFLFVPFWCAIAEKYRRHRELLVLALFAWLFSTVGILLVPKEVPKACLKMHKKRVNISSTDPEWFDFSPIREGSLINLRRRNDDGVFDDYSPINIVNVTEDFEMVYDENNPENHLPDTSLEFILLMILTIIGVSIASPAQCLADICTLKILKNQEESFGQQAVWAAAGSAMFTYTVGTIVSFITKENPCTKITDTNYAPCFYAFAFFMALTIIVATKFAYSVETAEAVDLDETIATFWECMKTINDVHLASLLVVTFYCGFGNGFISTFLFWHLREMGGLQFLLAIVSLINSTAEVLFYILSDRLIGYVGHFRLIYLGLLFFSARFFYYSFLREPWLVLPIEVTHGMTSAAIRSCMISYIRQEGATVNILHGLFNGIYGGLGFSIGGLVGGFMVHSYGHSITFLIFGEISLLTLFCFILINNVWPLTKHERKVKSGSTRLSDMLSSLNGNGFHKFSKTAQSHATNLNLHVNQVPPKLSVIND